MLKTVEGIFKQGRVELLETPELNGEARVLVTFLEQNGTVSPPRIGLVRGKYAGPNMSTEEDFKIAEWRGEDFDDDAPAGASSHETPR